MVGEAAGYRKDQGGDPDRTQCDVGGHRRWVDFLMRNRSVNGIDFYVDGGWLRSELT